MMVVIKLKYCNIIDETIGFLSVFTDYHKKLFNSKRDLVSKVLFITF